MRAAHRPGGDRLYPDHSPQERAIGDIIPKLMKRLGLEDTHWLTLLAEEWQEMVGEAVARHTRPGRLENKDLVVFVDNSAWLSELSRYGRKEMLAKLQERFGSSKIASLRLQLDPEAKG